jgi:hypothetical protein
MNDRPDALQLIAAVREFLAAEVVPACDDHRLKFRALIATNVLSIVERQLEAGDGDLDGAATRLAALEVLYDDRLFVPSDTIDRRLRALCRAIRSGMMDDAEAWHGAMDFARWHVESKLRISNPRYLIGRADATALPKVSTSQSASRKAPE